MQIVQAMGFQPSPPQPQPIANSAGVFTNPHIAAAAEHVVGLTGSPAPPQDPTINTTGMYHNPHIGAVAEQLDKLASKKPPLPKQPTKA